MFILPLIPDTVNRILYMNKLFTEFLHELYKGRIFTEPVLVKNAIQKYEKSGMHLGDVAADVILDNNLHLWLLELQLNYGAEKVPGMPPEVFKEIMVTPFKYAKRLAGF